MKRVKEEKTKQIRITIPKWIADLKRWNNSVHLELVPLIDNNDKPITKETVFIIKELKKNG